MLKILQSFFNFGEKIAETEKSIIEHRAENDIIKDKHNYKKATDIAERIISITYKYYPWMKNHDKKLLDTLITQFNKYN